MSTNPPTARRPLTFVLLGLLALAGVGLGIYLSLPPKVPPIAMDAALAANLRGLGHMERFEYVEAAEHFTNAAAIAPDWLPAKINLAYALVNQNTPDAVERARQLFAEVLARDADNKHAHYGIGIICVSFGPFDDAYQHFQHVHRLDPDDAHTLMRLGMTHPDGSESPAAIAHFEEALKRNPYLNSARYSLALAIRRTDPARANKLFDEHKALIDAVWETQSGLKYSEMGRYAECIGRDHTMSTPTGGPLPLFEPTTLNIKLAVNTRWATADDLDATTLAARQRFGGTMVLFDLNNDGRPDILLAAAVRVNDQVRDLLLRNDGQGQFTDITAEAGLGTTSLGAAAADFDNDGFADLALTGIGSPRLYRNQGNGTLTDVSAAVGLDKITGVTLGASWLDIDQDGDVDLLLTRFTTDDRSTFKASQVGGGLLLFENVGIAPPLGPQGPAVGLSVAFRSSDRLPVRGRNASTVGVVTSDLDADRDVDVLVLPDRADPVLIDNQRLLRFNGVAPAWATDTAHAWNGGLVLDANHDERTDLLLLRDGAAPLYLISQGERDLIAGKTNSPALKQATTTDLDFDGWPDVVGLDRDGRAVLLRNQGAGHLQVANEAFGQVGVAHALAVADLDGDLLSDLLVWQSDGLSLRRNRGNGHSAVWLSPTGKRDKGSDMRTNGDGLGVWAIAQAGTLWTSAERTTLSAGLGQSLLPLPLGIGPRSRADIVRLRWPDAVVQAELDVPAGLLRVSETNRKGTSCPVLMVWDGTKFTFVTDFLGAGALGESGPDGSIRPPRPEESVKVEPHQWALKDGRYLLKIAEPMDEVLYLDHLSLSVIDHPADVVVYPDERFVFVGPQPTQQLLAFRQRLRPTMARDDREGDWLAALKTRDRLAVDGFARRSWLGYAEEHSLTLDFPKLSGQGTPWLVLAGWTDYPYPESMYAATRAGVAIKPPTLEYQENGQWRSLGDLGFPAGLPRVMTRALPKDVRGGRLRISTNMQVYWDEVYLAEALNVGMVGKVHELPVTQAQLANRGFMQEVYPDGRPPVAYDDAKTEPVATTKWQGKLTRLGDVTELITKRDDRLVLCGPGDELTVQIDASHLPKLSEGWQRSFVLRTVGYCKDTSTTTVTGGEVGPLPFRTMPNYPAFGQVSPPKTDAAGWHTRSLRQR